jgi:hypothetical protein
LLRRLICLCMKKCIGWCELRVYIFYACRLFHELSTSQYVYNVWLTSFHKQCFYGYESGYSSKKLLRCSFYFDLLPVESFLPINCKVKIFLRLRLRKIISLGKNNMYHILGLYPFILGSLHTRHNKTKVKMIEI